MPSEFATKLTTWMNETRVSVRELGEAANVSGTDISHWRTGKRAPTRLALAKLLAAVVENYDHAVAVKLLIAHLRDEMPEAMRKEVHIEPAIGFDVLRSIDPQVEINAWLDDQARSSASFTVWLQFMRELMQNAEPPSFQLMRKENPKFGTAFPDLIPDHAAPFEESVAEVTGVANFSEVVVQKLHGIDPVSTAFLAQSPSGHSGATTGSTSAQSARQTAAPSKRTASKSSSPDKT